MKTGPIILIEDDAEDKMIFEENLRDLEVKNELIWIDNTKDAFDFLKSTTLKPFVIMCDVNMPMEDGIELKMRIDNDPELRSKSIPFVFYSTSVNQDHIDKAYKEMTVQGFFQKGNDYKTIKKNLKIIIDYWTYCKHPNQ
jgi:CheY-like chemotaxis protein